MPIIIKKSQNADTRTCDFTKVEKDTLLSSSFQHIGDVQKGMAFLVERLTEAGNRHDWTKITPEGISAFHKDFVTGFKTQDWYTMHKATERHHISVPEGVRDDINLIDVMEHIVDCVMAGMGRSGSVYINKIDDAVLQRAFMNTVELLKANVTVQE